MIKLHFLRLLLEMSSYICIAIVCFPGCDVRILKPFLFYQAVFPHDQKSQGKNLEILRTKRGFKTRKAFFHHLKWLSLKQIKQTFWASPILRASTDRIFKFIACQWLYKLEHDRFHLYNLFCCVICL